MPTSLKIRFRTNAVLIGQLLVPVPREVNRRVMNALAEVADESIKNAIAEHTQTGRLAESYYNRQTRDKRGRELGHDLKIAPHAKYVIEGTRPHEIRARKAKALYFFWPEINDYFIGKKVNHPGYAGDDYINRALVDAMNAFQSVMASTDVQSILKD